MRQALDRGDQKRIIPPLLAPPSCDVEGPTPPKIKETTLCLMHTLVQLPAIAPLPGKRYSYESMENPAC